MILVRLIFSSNTSSSFSGTNSSKIYGRSPLAWLTSFITLPSQTGKHASWLSISSALGNERLNEFQMVSNLAVMEFCYLCSVMIMNGQGPKFVHIPKSFSERPGGLGLPYINNKHESAIWRKKDEIYTLSDIVCRAIQFGIMATCFILQSKQSYVAF